MICELCGQEVPFLKPLMVEGSLLKVCQICVKFGTEAPVSVQTSKSVESGAGGRSQSSIGFGYSTSTISKDEIIRRRLEQRERRQTTRDIYEQTGVKELVDDYHKRIQQARSKLGWNQEQLGQKINERKSVISKIENKSMKPDDKLVRKLEKALGIKLMEVME
jgi:putative transcription factor